MLKGGKKINKNSKEKPKKKAVFAKKTVKKSAKKLAKNKIARKKVKLAVKVGSKTNKTANSSHIVEIKKNLNLEKEIKAEEIARLSKAKQPKIISEKLEKDKQLIMWSGIIFFMILVVFIWVYQIKSSISQTKSESNNQKTEEWKEVFSDLEENIGNLKTDLEKIKEFSEEPKKKLDDEIIEKVKNNFIGSSTTRILDIASSTNATSSE